MFCGNDSFVIILTINKNEVYNISNSFIIDVDMISFLNNNFLPYCTLFLIYFVSLQQLKLSQPNPDDLGYVDSISVEEIGGARVC